MAEKSLTDLEPRMAARAKRHKLLRNMKAYVLITGVVFGLLAAVRFGDAVAVEIAEGVRGMRA